MPSIQVKDVPAEVHATLRVRAAAAGQSLQDYLLHLLAQEAAHPTLNEVLTRAGGRSGGNVSMQEIVDAVRSGRDSP